MSALASQLAAQHQATGQPSTEPAAIDGELKTWERDAMLHVRVRSAAHGLLNVGEPTAVRVLNIPSVQ